MNQRQSCRLLSHHHYLHRLFHHHYLRRLWRHSCLYRHPLQRPLHRIRLLPLVHLDPRDRRERFAIPGIQMEMHTQTQLPKPVLFLVYPTPFLRRRELRMRLQAVRSLQPKLQPVRRLLLPGDRACGSLSRDVVRTNRASLPPNLPPPKARSRNHHQNRCLHQNRHIKRQAQRRDLKPMCQSPKHLLRSPDEYHIKEGRLPPNLPDVAGE